MIVVYWMSAGKPMASEFKTAELIAALKLVEKLRTEGNKHVCISSEYEDCVSQAGVSDILPKGYDWKKRRK